MQKILAKEEKTIPYSLRSHKRAKRVRIAVSYDGVVVTKPRRVSVWALESILKRQFDWILAKIEEFKKRPKKILQKYTRADFRENKEKAREIVLVRITHFNQFFGYEIGRVTIKNQKTRWGSCSSRKNLSFNYKIVFLPADLQDYLVVHELCHLGEMNHSRNFWGLVATQIPDYKERVLRLRKF